MPTPSDTDLAGASCSPLGDDWGAPLWRLEGEGWSIDVHADDEQGARAAAAAHLETTAAATADDEPVTRAEMLATITAAVPGADIAVLERAADMRAAEPPTPPGVAETLG